MKASHKRFVWLSLAALTALITISLTCYIKFDRTPFNSLEHLAKPDNSYPILKVSELTIERTHHAVNGALAAISSINKQYLFAHRIDHDNYTSNYHSELILTLLDNEFKPLKTQTLTLEKHSDRVRAQDPRIFALNEQLYLLYNEIGENNKTRSMYIANLALTSIPTITKNSRLEYQAGKNLNQKNWTPLVYNNNIYFIYSFAPLIVLEWDQDKNILTKVEAPKDTGNLKWPYGEIRGGTPAIFIKELNAYLTFFHSSLKYKDNEPEWHLRKEPFWRIYYMGAALLDNKPPFKVIAYTTKPLIYPGMYADNKRNMHIIFPVGVVQNDEDFIISVGLQDTSTALLNVKKKDLYNSFSAI